MKHSIHSILIILLLPALLPIIIQAQNLRLTNGVHLVVQGGANLVLDNAGIINDGKIDIDSGTVIFTGNRSGGTAHLSGGNPISFNNIRIDRSFNDVVLDNDILVTGTVQMSQGLLQLNNHMLDLGYTGLISGENNQSYITGLHGGSIKITASLNAPQAVNPGNIGVELTSASNLGLTVIRRGHIQQTGINGETSIERSFEIVPEINTGLDASLRFYYLDGELANNNRNDLGLFTSLADGKNSWSPWENGNIGRDDHSVLGTHLDQLHRYTLAVGTIKGSNITVGNPSVRLYPNPTVDRFTVTLYSTREKSEIIQLFDPLGHLLEQKTFHCIPGANSLQWNIGKYSAGTYILRFGNPSLRNLQIVKQ